MRCSMWKTQGAIISPWREDVILGADKADEQFYFVLTAKKNYNLDIYYWERPSDGASGSMERSRSDAAPRRIERPPTTIQNR